MNERQWVACVRPQRLLDYIQRRASKRKRQLLTCGCWRRIWATFTEPLRHSLEIAERFADGETSFADLDKFHSGIFSLETVKDFPEFFFEDESSREQERLAICQIIRDVFGPLLFRSVDVDPSWLVWNQGTISQLAKELYENRQMPSGTLDSVHLPILADALEEAGCTNLEILAHLRGDSDHVRGCWVLDLLLGQK